MTPNKSEKAAWGTIFVIINSVPTESFLQLLHEFARFRLEPAIACRGDIYPLAEI